MRFSNVISVLLSPHMVWWRNFLCLDKCNDRFLLTFLWNMTWRHWIVRAKEYNVFGKPGTDFGLTGVIYQKNCFLNLKNCS